MNPVQRFFQNYVRAMLAAVGIFFLLNILLVFLIMNVTRKDDYFPHFITQDFASLISERNGEVYVESKAAEQLSAVDAWAMLLDESGNVIWEEQLPERLNRSYSAVDIAKFSRWYLDGYPVFIWEHDLGLLVIGYPRDSMVKYSYTVGPKYYPHLVIGVFAAFAANLLLMLFLLLRNSRSVEKSLKPMPRHSRLRRAYRSALPGVMSPDSALFPQRHF